MRKFKQTNEIIKLMHKKEIIRNIGVIAHIDHGKTTMTDSLMAEAGLLSPTIVGFRALDYLEEEQKRGITIKTANISLLHETQGISYLINLVDTPGHVDFTGKVARALRAIDGAVVVVDAVEEIMAQTETVTRQALEEMVKPVLFINKVDRLIEEIKLSEKEIQNKFARIIKDFNNLIEIYAEPQFKKKWKVNPEKESVAFGSALHRWGLTVSIANEKGIKFTDLIDVYEKKRRKELSRLIPLHNAILNMVVKNIPNPVEAQRYRIPKIWKGPIDSEIGRAMLNCDENRPATMCITNVQSDMKEGLIATGRLFSGSLKEGDNVYLVNAGKECSVKQVSIYMGSFRESVNQITAGNITALAGLDSARAGETLVDVKYKEVMVPFERIKYLSEPVMTIAVEPKNPKDLPRLIEAANRLSIEDPNIFATMDKETGHYLLSGIGELQLEIAIKLLAEYNGGIELLASNPAVTYRESITAKGATVTTKTPNKQNSFRVQVEPLKKEVVELIEKGEFTEEMSEKFYALNKYGNMLVNLTDNIDVEEVKESIILGFHWACGRGPLCEEPLRGVKVNLVDAQIHEDPKLHETAQVMRAISRAILGSVLTAKPLLLEPIYKIEVSVQTQWFGACSNIITRRRGKIQATENRGILTMINGYIPVSETFGLSAELRSATSGRAFWQCTFSHWEKTPENVAAEVIKQIRARRGLPPKIPKSEKFINAI
ncbi:MAG: elongation factor EF-2 [Candidatus Bathyarchaeota archaeon]|nr:elongation factor EF-2 [Candidatus Bathyarchaeota archaeon]